MPPAGAILQEISDVESLAPGDSAPVWNISTIDPNSGKSTSIGVDSASQPHITYIDLQRGALLYAFQNRTGWHIEVIDDSLLGDQKTSLAMDSRGDPHIAYTDVERGFINYAMPWNNTNVKRVVPECISLDLNSADQAYIVYGITSELDKPHGLFWVTNHEGGWNTFEIDATANPTWCSIAVDSERNGFHIGYYDANQEEIRYAWPDSGGWHITAIDRTGLNWFGSLAIDSGGHPRMAYADDGGDLVYAWSDDSGWHTRTIDRNVMYVSMAIDAADNPHIAYNNPGESLKYAWQDGSGWHTTTVDSAAYPGVGYYCSIAVDAEGHPHISYYDWMNNALKYAYGTIGVSDERYTGSIFAWGSNDFGQCSNIPEGDDFIAVAAGDYHSIALKENGGLAAWGYNNYGQCDIPTGNDYIAIDAAYMNGMALRQNGSVVVWGSNEKGQCNVPAGTSFHAIAAGDLFCVGLKDDGSLVAWGDNSYKQCKVPAGNDFVAISSGDCFSLALRKDGSIAAWGLNQFGQCSVPAGNNYTAVSAGSCCALALRKDGTVIGWGMNNVNQCNPPAGNDFHIIVSGDQFSCALRGNNSIATWGENWYGLGNPPKGDGYLTLAAGQYHAVSLHPSVQVNTTVSGGNGTANPPSQAAVFGSDVSVSFIPDTGYRVAAIIDNGVEQAVRNPFIVSGVRTNHEIVVTFETVPSEFTVNATVIGGHGTASPFQQTIMIQGNATITLSPDSGYETGAIFDNGISQQVLNPYIIPNIQDPHDVVIVFIPVAGGLAAWGYDDKGSCVVPAGINYTAVAAGWGASLAIRNGTLAGWGDNGHGECSVPPGGDYLSLASGYFHGLALRRDGSVAAWGDNEYGQCSVPSGTGFAAIGAGGSHSLAIALNGSLVAWGDASHQMGTVPAGNDFTAVAAGDYHSLALRHDGSIVAWGDNEYSQCNAPDGNDFTAIAAGGYHSLALAADGSITAWGRNDNGQCDVPEGQDYIAVSAGEDFSIALRQNGTVAAWGNHAYGQCDVPAGTFKAISAGTYHSLAIATTSGVPEAGKADFNARPVSGPAPLTVAFTDASTNNPDFWNYNFGDGLTSTEKNPLHTYRSPGTYTVTLTTLRIEKGILVKSTKVKQDLITVGGSTGPGLRPDFTASPLSGLSPLSVSFTDASAGSPDFWRYSFGDGTSSDSKNPFHEYLAPGNYTVNLTVMRIENGVLVRNTTLKKDLITVTGTLQSSLAANFTAAPLSGPAPLRVAFTDTSTGGPDFWGYHFGDGTSSSSKNPVHTYLMPGTYDVTLTVIKIENGKLARNTTVRQDLISIQR